MAAMFVEMLHDEEDQAIISPDSESKISDADDLDYVPQGQSGVVGENPALLWRRLCDDIEDLSDESSEEETQTQSKRLIKNGFQAGKRRTRLWPMVLWCNVLDVATLNAYTRGDPGQSWVVTDYM